MKKVSPLPSKILSLITNTDLLSQFDTLELVRRLIPYGLNWVQVREKKFSKLQLSKFLIEMRKITEGKCKLLVNDNFDLASECGCDGIHLPEKLLDFKPRIEKLQKNFIIGRSFHRKILGNEKWLDHFDYIQLGSIFHTESHPSIIPNGIELLEESTKQEKIPIVAVGGINSRNISKVISTGVKGVAIMRGILNSGEPEREIQKISLNIFKN